MNSTFTAIVSFESDSWNPRYRLSLFLYLETWVWALTLEALRKSNLSEYLCFLVLGLGGRGEFREGLSKSDAVQGLCALSLPLALALGIESRAE